LKVLILGATGHVGQRLALYLVDKNIEVISASRGKLGGSLPGHVILDSLDQNALIENLQGVDAVVNCVAGNRDSIATGAEMLVNAAIASGKPRIIHLSTMSVYGGFEGTAAESAPYDPGHNWYASAKCEAELSMQSYVGGGGHVVVLRPGCIHGPGSIQWVTRICNLIESRRLGDLGIAGDGWSNLIHVDDVVKAIYAGISLPMTTAGIQIYNLASPDSPRWNDYFVDLARAMGATPAKRITQRQLKLDSKIFSPAVKVTSILLAKLKLQTQFLPEPLPPSLVKLFRQEILLDSTAASRDLKMDFMPYQSSLSDSVQWFLEH